MSMASQPKVCLRKHATPVTAACEISTVKECQATAIGWFCVNRSPCFYPFVLEVLIQGSITYPNKQQKEHHFSSKMPAGRGDMLIRSQEYIRILPYEPTLLPWKLTNVPWKSMAWKMYSRSIDPKALTLARGVQGENGWDFCYLKKYRDHLIWDPFFGRE